MSMLEQDTARRLAITQASIDAPRAEDQARTLAACINHITELEMLLRDVLAENWTFLPNGLALRIQIALREVGPDGKPINRQAKEAANG